MLSLASCAAVAGHGYLAYPVSRNVISSNYCPQCFNGPGACGDPRGEHSHEKPGRPTATLKRGGTLRARVVITANHLGRWSLALCPTTAPGCSRLLRRADGAGAYVYLPGSASSSTATFRIPRRAPARGVLRWRYETGNTCTPRGTPRRFANPSLATCVPSSPQEIFSGCADVKLV